jgi:hypothetical protein
MSYDYRFDSGSFFVFLLSMLLILALVAFYVYCFWKLFEKAGKPGWATLISGHNIVVLLEIIGHPGWWYFFFIVPIVNLVLGIMLIFELVKVFGKDTGFGCLTILFPYVMVPILALGDAKYLGPIVNQPVQTPPAQMPLTK